MEKKERYEAPEVKVWKFEEINMAASDSTGFGGIDDGGADEFE